MNESLCTPICTRDLLRVNAGECFVCVYVVVRARINVRGGACAWRSVCVVEERVRGGACACVYTFRFVGV